MKRSNVKTATARKGTKKQKAARKPSPGTAQPVVALIETLVNEETGCTAEEEKVAVAPKKGKKAKAPKVEAERQPCCCGCGGLAKAGKFWLPGHDARAKGVFLRAMRGEKVELSKEFRAQYLNFGFMAKNREWMKWAEANL